MKKPESLITKHQEVPEAKNALLRSNLSKIIHTVAEYSNIDKEILYKPYREQRQSPRAISIYLSHKQHVNSLHSLNEIALAFRLGHHGSISSLPTSIEQQLKEKKSLINEFD